MASDLTDWTVILPRLLAATATGVALGIDRDIHQKPAGVRVLSMVSLGSAAAVMVAQYAADGKAEASARVIQGVLSGVGFLGAGVILHEISNSKQSAEVRGLATAASVWVAAILGLAAGMGQWLIGTLTVMLSVLILVGGRSLEKFLHRLAPSNQNNSSDPPSNHTH